MKNKWQKQLELDRDKFQYKLCALGIEKNDSPLATITTVNYAQNVFCPFCLHIEPLRRFVLNKRLGLCPECNNRMLIETLLCMLKWNGSDYARFVYEYPFAYFWSKCSNKFETWKNRLYNLNMSFEFWETYKYLKEQESYTEVEINE